MWSTDWFRDPDGAVLSILRSLEQAERVAPHELVEVAPRETRPGRDGWPAQTASPPLAQRTATHAPGAPYEKYQGHKRPRGTMLSGVSFVTVIASDIAAIVGTEAPIHEELIAERLKEIYGVDRAGSRIQSNIKRALGVAVRAHRLSRGRDPEFILGSGPVPQRFRTPGDGVKRSIQLIAPEEIAFAVLYLVEDQFGMQRDHIPHAVGSLFGFERVHSEAADRIAAVVDYLLEKGDLRSSGPSVYLS